MKAMIPAAGLGTRLKPLTDNKPKALVEVQGAPMLQHAIKYLMKFGFTDIIINVHHLAGQIYDFLKKNQNFGINIQISDESDLLLDTGGAIKKAEPFFENEPFLVFNVDIFTNINIHELIKYHKNSDALITMAVKNRETTRPILFDEDLNLCEWRNLVTGDKKICREANGKLTPFGFSCVQVINPGIFDLIKEKGPFPIIPFYLDIASKHKIKAYVHNESEWYEVGRYENIAEINAKKLDFL
jgi:MurNAc alpha-1-phosphate uridylyltransferase